MKPTIVAILVVIFSAPIAGRAQPPCPDSATSLAAFANCMVPLANGTGMALAQRGGSMIDMEPVNWYGPSSVSMPVTTPYPYAAGIGYIAAATLSGYANRYNYLWYSYGWGGIPYGVFP